MNFDSYISFVRRSVKFDNLVFGIASRYVEVKRKAPAVPIRTKSKSVPCLNNKSIRKEMPCAQRAVRGYILWQTWRAIVW